MRDQEESEQKLQYFPTQVKEMHVREMITPAQPTADQRPFSIFMTLIISI